MIERSPRMRVPAPGRGAPPAYALTATRGNPAPLGAGERMDLDLTVATLAARTPNLSARGP
jgi:hypothetical protein